MTKYIGPPPIPQATMTKQSFTATSGQTTFTTLGYTSGDFVLVHLNGVLLKLTDDYAASNGSTIVLTTGAETGDILDFVTFSAFEVPDSVSASSGGSFSGAISVGGNVTATGNVTASGDVTAGGKIGLDSTDYLTFTNNTQMDVYINGSNEFRFEADGDFHADGNVIAYSTTIASDAALKENLKRVTGLESVMALDGVSFDWKRDGKKSAGVIAQQVRGVLPEAVTEVNAMDGSKHLSVNYNALTSVLIEAIKDLKTEIEDLKNGSHK